MKPATHLGNCQACGRQQCIMENGLANHGYTVEFEYFHGTCRGSGHKPMQVERTLTDSTIEGLLEYAASSDATVEKLKAGKAHPARIKTGQKYNHTTYKYEPVYIDWDCGTKDQQAKALDLAIAMEESNARHARAHARDLKALVDRVHGTEPVLIVEPVKTEKPQATVDIKAAKVHGAFGSKAARKAELDRVNHLYEKEIDKLQAIYLAMPHDQRNDENNAVYYAPMYPHQWRPKHSALALKCFPQAAAIVAEIEALVAARDAIKNAP